MKHLVTTAEALLLLVLLPAAALAVPVAMTPDPLGDWVVTDRTADVTLQSGNTSPVPTLVLRTSVVGGGALDNVTVSFDFDFDVDVSSASVTLSSGSFGVPPNLFPGGGDVLMTFNCSPSPCIVDIMFEFAAAPVTLDVTDTNNQFIHSPGAPGQTLTATFADAPVAPDVSIPALGSAALVALGVGILVAGRRTLPRSRPRVYRSRS